MSRVFYGWSVVAAAFVVTLVGFGCAYTFSTFVRSLQEEFGASRGSVSLVFSVAGFLYFSLGVITGPLADRWGARRLAVSGMIFVGAGLVLAGQARSLAEIYAAYGLGIGLGVGCAYVPALGAVQRWFSKHRALASGMAVSGIGVGTLALPPLAALLIDSLGWRNAYVVLGCGAAVIGGGMALLIVDDPRERGLLPDGESPSASTVPAKAGITLGAAIRSKPFLILYAACLICSFGAFVPFVHLVSYATDHGISQSSATALLGAIGVGSTVGRFLLGGLADRLGRTTTLVAMIVGMAAALGLWSVTTGIWWLATFALSYGVFYGGWVAVLPALVMDYFGGRNVSGIIGALYTSVAFGTLLGPSSAGWLFDITGSYTVPITVSALATLASAAIVSSLLKMR
jgi:MFS family permease